MFSLYFLINEARTKTYIGFSNDLNRRMEEYRLGKIKTTKNFGNFIVKILEEVETVQKARTREKYWKSSAGRRKLKNLF